jgi:hypothetical protein
MIPVDLMIGIVCILIMVLCGVFAHCKSLGVSLSALIAAACLFGIAFVSGANVVMEPLESTTDISAFISSHGPHPELEPPINRTIDTESLRERMHRAARRQLPIFAFCELALCITVWRFARRDQSKAT